MKDILIHTHIFYSELWPELKSSLQNMGAYSFDLYVTMVEKHKDIVADIKKTFQNAHIEIVENRGYDIAPFVYVLNKSNLNDYKYVIKLHTKRNFEAPLSEKVFKTLRGAKWRKALLSIFSSAKKIKQYINSFETDPTLGMVGSYKTIVTKDTYINEDEKEKIQKFAQKHAFNYTSSRFIGGTMFIARACVFQGIKNLNLTMHDFSIPDKAHSFNLANIIERLFGYFVCQAGYTICDPLVTKGQLRRWNLHLKIDHIRYKSIRLLLKINRLIYYLVSEKWLYQTRYADWLYRIKKNKSVFEPLTSTPYHREKSDVKIFAFYLPQFYAIPENDSAHGKGFTEWVNVASIMPQFIGHDQPKIPYDVGFYNLLGEEGMQVMRRQVELAQIYGIYGFCFHYYWFSGKKILEKPLEQFLASDINFPFHCCWANENWSKLWDGGNKKLILEQKLQKDDAKRFFDDLLPFIKDKRYEKINNKPLLLIYRPAIFPKKTLLAFIDEINRLARQHGFDGFYLMASNAFNFDKPKEYGFEGIIEFPPHTLAKFCPTRTPRRINPHAKFYIYDLHPYVQSKGYFYDADYTVFKTCFPSWDNLPRKLYSGGFTFHMDDDDFKNWLSGIIDWTVHHNEATEQYVYINAWNEWAEGAILEPTQRFGYKALSVVKHCLEEQRANLRSLDKNKTI